MLSLAELDMSNPLNITAQNKDAIQSVIWEWPRIADWKIPGEYRVKVSLGYIDGQDLMGPPKWDPPVPFTFNVVDK